MRDRVSRPSGARIRRHEMSAVCADRYLTCHPSTLRHDFLPSISPIPPIRAECIFPERLVGSKTRRCTCEDTKAAALRCKILVGTTRMIASYPCPEALTASVDEVCESRIFDQFASSCRRRRAILDQTVKPRLVNRLVDTEMAGQPTQSG